MSLDVKGGKSSKVSSFDHECFFKVTLGLQNECCVIQCLDIGTLEIKDRLFCCLNSNKAHVWSGLIFARQIEAIFGRYFQMAFGQMCLSKQTDGFCLFVMSVFQ